MDETVLAIIVVISFVIVICGILLLINRRAKRKERARAFIQSIVDQINEEVKRDV